jgi:P-aminobenzoate N-oxygenase AurF
METATLTRRPQQALNIKGSQYARCIEISKRIRWDIDRDVIRGRSFDFSRKFLPDGLSKANLLEFCTPRERRLLSQIQGRTYANMFGVLERFIGAKMLELGGTHSLGDQTAFEALVRFTDEELKHQELFRRIERMIAREMPGYEFGGDPNSVAWLVLGKSTWAVLAFTCMGELFTQDHYRASIAHDEELSDLYKDVFLFHWKEESQHAVLDELEWRREDAKLTPAERDAAVDDLIALAKAVDAMIQPQAAADSDYFIGLCKRAFTREEIARVHETVLYAYRTQYITSGVENRRFSEILASLVSQAQGARIAAAVEPLVSYRPAS